jgi:hypothetical protein
MIKAQTKSDQILMGLTYVTVSLNAAGHRRKFQSKFLADTGATDTLAPADQLRKIGIKPIGKMACELADGTLEEFEFGLAEISFMDETTAGRVLFGPEWCGTSSRGDRFGVCRNSGRCNEQNTETAARDPPEMRETATSRPDL